MTDLTKGSVARHIASMAGFIAAGLLVQSAYFIVDLYFVSRLGKDAVAGVSAAGNFSFLGIAGAQMVGVGSLSLISQAAGRRDQPYANLVFNQVCGLGLVAALITLFVGYLCAVPAMARLGADPSSASLGALYLFGYLPAMATMFPVTAISSGLRATGIVQPTMLVQSASVLLNVVLAPILIAGWISGHPLGAFGAGLASSICACLSLTALIVMLPRVQSYLHNDRTAWKPRLAVWLSMLKVGLPAAGEFFLMFLIAAVIYWTIRRFGPEAQAGYGIGTRVMQALFLPVLAVSFAAAPIAGQNFGARLDGRVAATFRTSLAISVGLMAALTILCQWRPDLLVAPFTSDPAVSAVALKFLRVISWNFVAAGIAMSCSGMFQAFGDTRPSFISSATRLVTFAAPAIWLTRQPWAVLADFWHLSVASQALQAVFSLLLLRREFTRKLGKGEAPVLLAQEAAQG